MRHYPKRVKPIGGYLELQLPEGEEFYSSLIKLNTARNSLEYILKANNYSAIYIPYFTCEVLLEPIRKLGLTYYFYTINKDLDPVIDFNIEPTECLLYTNYFGIKQATIKRLSRQVKSLIVDNSQAFFSKPLPGVDTFYSCRKFFGVADGAYLQCNLSINLKLEKDVSFDRMSHLLKSLDLGIENGYENFKENNEVLVNNPIKRMSTLTGKILKTIDYEACREIRNRNFQTLHQALSHKNKLVFDVSEIDGPLCYPLLTEKEAVKRNLISKRIFIPVYWPNVLKWTTDKMFENYLATNLVALPVDHRYSEGDMTRIINYLKQLI
jgi:hypothetical protein